MAKTIKKVRFAVPGGVIRSRDGKEEKCTHIECSVGYELGGHSYWTGQNSSRGYYAYVRPVTVHDSGSYSFTMFVGGKWLLVPCNRQGRKKEVEAEAAFNANIRDYVGQLYESDAVDFAAAA